MTIHALFRAQAGRTPEAVALSGGGTTMSYRHLDEHSDLVAGRLAAAGAGPEKVVAICADRSPGLISTLLAVLKTGAAYLVLDPADPPARAEAVLADSGAALVLASGRHARRLPAGPAPVLRLDSLLTATGPATAFAALPDGDPAGLAYVAYTSGSTGEAKGVAVPHEAVLRLVTDPNWITVTPSDSLLSLAPIAFDASTFEIWGCLTAGARLVVQPAGPVTVDAVATTVRDNGVTVLWLTAGLFHRLADDRPDALAGVRHLLAGGDVVSAEHVRRVLGAYPGMLFTNGYGPTENTTFTTCWTSSRPPADDLVPIGRPITGTRVRVLDERQQEVPTGAVGELYAGGSGLARGYLGRPGSTAERFVPDPTGESPGARLYRTGDLVRRLPDGAYAFDGRADDQVKINGYRVEPRAVEARLRADETVRDAAVVARPAGADGRRLVAYVVPAGSTVDTFRLAENLRTHLPPYAVPASILPIPALPLTPNGKVDRAALPELDRAPRDLFTTYVAPRTALEAALADIWSAGLAVEPVGVDDDFFELGGHSLLAAELVRRVQRELSVTFPAEAIYLQPTVAELARVIEATKEDDRAVVATDRA
ncbi:amino acid adenylation domain-containing protein [Jidongwangia harbinensis]|uniref:amino acid adenylation domain-containing protein n=1 Tax=Jidongwangia harbinensis TaxID=2878561 RepID=UPI001CD9F022|nr:non-ribosomal peptide synthetase [Jidongwangia harbinensis]MCA2219347.1 non-ribosomal peptide synthetase [Jidongwangia harbinensis]